MSITGSGKYVQIEQGIMKLGQTSDPTSGTIGEATAYAASYSGKNGIRCNIGYLNLTNVSELSIGIEKGYTGVIPMLVSYSSPYPIILWDPDDWNINNVSFSFRNYRFVNGLMVGTA